MYRAVVSLSIFAVASLICCGQGPSAASRPSPAAEPAGSSLPIEAQYAVSEAVGRDDSRYHALETVAGVELENPAHGLRLVFDRDGATLQANSVLWRMGLLSWGGAATHASP